MAYTGAGGLMLELLILLKKDQDVSVNEWPGRG